MYSLIHNAEARRALAIEAPCLVAALLVAEVSYKFHSFTLECVAFLATWTAMSAVATLVTRWLRPAAHVRD
jgi:hypothetical protein